MAPRLRALAAALQAPHNLWPSGVWVPQAGQATGGFLSIAYTRSPAGTVGC